MWWRQPWRVGGRRKLRLGVARQGFAFCTGRAMLPYFLSMNTAALARAKSVVLRCLSSLTGPTLRCVRWQALSDRARPRFRCFQISVNRRFGRSLRLLRRRAPTARRCAVFQCPIDPVACPRLTRARQMAQEPHHPLATSQPWSQPP